MRGEVMGLNWGQAWQEHVPVPEGEDEVPGWLLRHAMVSKRSNRFCNRSLFGKVSISSPLRSI